MNEDRFKFRAWDKATNRMYYPEGVTLEELSTLAKEIALENDEPDYQDQWFIDNEKCIWLQCTGLKDKEGKLIFEGDIIKDGDDYWPVKFVDDWARYYRISTPSPGKTFMHEFSREFSEKKFLVVGNIYENPDLIATEEK